MQEGDRVLLAWASANRDPASFDRPDEVDIHRWPNRHAAFGIGRPPLRRRPPRPRDGPRADRPGHHPDAGLRGRRRRRSRPTRTQGVNSGWQRIPTRSPPAADSARDRRPVKPGSRGSTPRSRRCSPTCPVLDLTDIPTARRRAGGARRPRRCGPRAADDPSVARTDAYRAARGEPRRAGAGPPAGRAGPAVAAAVPALGARRRARPRQRLPGRPADGATSSRAVGCVAVSVDWRRAPEHPYPAEIDDCYAALRWMAAEPTARLDPDRLAVGGASSGGGTAAGLALLARDRGGPPIACQLLVYPMLDDRDVDGASAAWPDDPDLWHRRKNALAWAAYLAGADAPVPAVRGTGPGERPARAARRPSSRPATWTSSPTRTSSTRRGCSPPGCPPSCMSTPAGCTVSTSSRRMAACPGVTARDRDEPSTCPSRRAGRVTRMRVTTLTRGSGKCVPALSAPLRWQHMPIMCMIFILSVEDRMHDGRLPRPAPRGVTSWSLRGGHRPRRWCSSGGASGVPAVTTPAAASVPGPARGDQGRLDQPRPPARRPSPAWPPTRATRSRSTRSTHRFLGNTKTRRWRSSDTTGKTADRGQQATPGVADKDVAAVFGSVSSHEAVAQAPIAEKAKMPIIFTQAGSEGVVIGDYTYRVDAADEQLLPAHQGASSRPRASSRWASSTRPARRPSRRSARRPSRRMAQSAGYRGHRAASPRQATTQDFTRADPAGAAGATRTCVVHPPVGASNPTAMKQLRQAGYTEPVLGNSGASAGNLKPAGADGAGMVWAVDFNYQQDRRSRARSSSRPYQAKFPGEYAAELRRRGLRRGLAAGPGHQGGQQRRPDRDPGGHGQGRRHRRSPARWAPSLKFEGNDLRLPGRRRPVGRHDRNSSTGHRSSDAGPRRVRQHVLHGPAVATIRGAPLAPGRLDQTTRKGGEAMAQDLINALALGSIYLLFALGMSLAWGTIDILNFAHGSIFMFSAFTAYLVVNQVRLPMLVVILIAAVAGAVMSLAVQVLAFEPILQTSQGPTRRRDADPHRRHRRRRSSRWRSRSTTPRATRSASTNSSFQVTMVYTFGDVRVTNVQIIDRSSSPLVLGIGIGCWLRRLAQRAGAALDRRRPRDRLDHGHRPPPAGAASTMTIAGALAGLAGVAAHLQPRTRSPRRAARR